MLFVKWKRFPCGKFRRLTDKLTLRKWIIHKRHDATLLRSVIAIKMQWKRSTSWSFLHQQQKLTSNRYFMEISRNCIFHRKSFLFTHKRFIQRVSGSECHGFCAGRKGLTVCWSWLFLSFLLSSSRMVKWKAEHLALICEGIFFLRSRLSRRLRHSILQSERARARTCVIRRHCECHVSDVRASAVLMMICVRRTCKFCLLFAAEAQNAKQNILVMGNFR